MDEEKLLNELLAKTEGGPYDGTSITLQESYVVNDALKIMQRAKRLLDGKEVWITATEEKLAEAMVRGDDHLVSFYRQDLKDLKNEARILRLIIHG